MHKGVQNQLKAAKADVFPTACCVADSEEDTRKRNAKEMNNIFIKNQCSAILGWIELHSKMKQCNKNLFIMKQAMIEYKRKMNMTVGVNEKTRKLSLEKVYRAYRHPDRRILPFNEG